MDKLRWLAIAALLFLAVAVDFTSRIMSILADGVLIIGVVVLIWPIISLKAK